MFGLQKCSEKDFYEFMYSNSKYHPRDADGYLLGSLIAILVFLGIGGCYIEGCHIKCPYLISMVIKSFIIADIGLFIFSRVNNKKYAFKFQRFFVIVTSINWFVFSIIVYPLPLILSYYENDNTLIKIIIYTIILGLIYLICIFIRLIILIRKGEMGKDCVGLNERLFGKKIRYLGFSVPIIVIASKLGRRAGIAMDNMGSLILMFVLAFIIQIALDSIIPECIIVAYCKSRFESFNFSYESYLTRGKKGKKPIKQKNK